MDALKIGDRVRYVGRTVIEAQPGTEGVIVGFRPTSFMVDFPTGREICWAAELERVEVEQ